MENLRNIGPFLNDFISWYTEFLEKLREFEIHKKGSEANRASTDFAGIPQIVEMDGTAPYYRIRDTGVDSHLRGNMEELLAKEEFLMDKIRDLSVKYDVTPKPWFVPIGVNSGIAQYDLFVQGFELPLDEEKGLNAMVYLWFDDTLNSRQPGYELRDLVLLMFSDRFKIPLGDDAFPGQEMIYPAYTFKHPSEKCSVNFQFVEEVEGNLYDNDGNRAIKFTVIPRDDYVIPNSLIQVKRDVLGTEALGLFLELLSYAIKNQKEADN